MELRNNIIHRLQKATHFRELTQQQRLRVPLGHIQIEVFADRVLDAPLAKPAIVGDEGRSLIMGVDGEFPVRSARQPGIRS